MLKQFRKNQIIGTTTMKGISSFSGKTSFINTNLNNKLLKNFSESINEKYQTVHLKSSQVIQQNHKNKIENNHLSHVLQKLTQKQSILNENDCNETEIYNIKPSIQKVRYGQIHQKNEYYLSTFKSGNEKQINNTLKEHGVPEQQKQTEQKDSKAEELFDNLINSLKTSSIIKKENSPNSKSLSSGKQIKEARTHIADNPQKNLKKDWTNNLLNDFLESEVLNDYKQKKEKPSVQNKQNTNLNGSNLLNKNIIDASFDERKRNFQNKTNQIEDSSYLRSTLENIGEDIQPNEFLKVPKLSKEKQNQQHFNKFESHWTVEESLNAIEQGKAFKGIFIANERNSNIGRISSEDIEGPIFINSPQDQNRAFHNSIVCFVIIDGNISSRLKSNESDVQATGREINNDNTIDTQSLIFQEEIQQKDPDEKMVAKIVHIFESPYSNSEPIVGSLRLVDESEQNDTKYGKIIKKNKEKNKKYWFIPKQSKLPTMIPVEFSPQFWKTVNENQVDITTQYVSISLKGWNERSFYPECIVQRCIGTKGDIEIECDALLEEFEVYNQNFSPETEQFLSSYRSQIDVNGEYIIPEEERQKRWDLTSEIICSIDPIDARDIDDALSVKKLNDDIYEIGVHIADVSHFVNPNTPIDQDARLRTTSVYLVHKVIPMLPRILCENLCSLNPNVERLAFSVFFQMKENGEILLDGPIRIGKSIINSCNKLSYDTFQLIIDNKIQSSEGLPVQNQPREGIDSKKMYNNLKLLARLGMNRREKRFENGVFSIDSSKKQFKLDEKFWPISYQIEERKAAHFVIEEFMLLANMIIGQQIVKEYPSLSVLRQHTFPSVEKQNQLNLIAKEFNHKVDFTNIKTINASIEQIQNDTNLQLEKKLFLKKQLFLILEQASYFVADTLPKNEWYHFALNFDIYTHFTSPIRRYPDLLVHRTMFAILQKNQQAIQEIDKKSLIDIMDLCNKNKAKAKKVSDGCQKIFVCLYLKQHEIVSNAMVVSFGATSMSIFVPDYEIQTTIFFQDYKDLKKITLDKKLNKIQLVYRTKKMPCENTIFFSPYSPIKISLTSTDQFPIDYKVKIAFPDADDPTLFHNIS